MKCSRSLSCVAPLTVALVFGCGVAESDDCYVHEPATASLRLALAEGVEPVVGETTHVFVQLQLDQGESCAQDLDFTCTCQDPPLGGPQEVSIVEARCPDGGCEVLSIGAYVHYGRELDVRLTASSTVLEVAGQTVGPEPTAASASLELQAAP